MKIYIGSDHAGFALKEKLKIFIKELGYEVEDKGAFSLEPTDDYPDFIIPVAKEVALHPDSLGIILGGSGEGEQISANKIDGVRAIEYYGGNLEIVKLGREHNDANVLSLGVRFIEEEEGKEAIKIFINTPFSNEERHVRRLKEIGKINKNFKILYYIGTLILFIIGLIFYVLKTSSIEEFPKKINYLELWPIFILIIFISLFIIKANRKIK
ncbi:MAG: Ribose-5-phosphate isomerase B [Candidatus Nomurabacteria bacterium GW2011_GWF2_35_66]|uniref:Ribose-5-phosphate isomerase B n=1 Tax=Candidatus Nomurabacteria bacterium GW2011_GWE1_35_16 TaxID=1618761 RepID=A0A0G0BB98_9BACT|nr:MAG: Ribose-5-phosphate isomerase B [Candidatus Nomurabacteria bacterium GW2011_GWF1_34_20]KKP63387.1 MAG: Ribose-5-phosphate isomerase B [Candidatus Nomurabacteria bacterium GW2011_GWE2_34_25]KKP66579.1 MAG: Ribose-5-phosphate isomerase B [Candidatus Nomurabacteria bacterium GW2011_GWE1_35_16]KKP83625.1 MAG: Ribose-5-phosphate isomerase B [Candidatus Nomurabacteria bacterium GW2011_GWF2_35_66]HAE36885.1 ribose-5-phosphate isomerase [Candidatus Nomurabacteria bacterium]